ncbi:MAG: bifunctional 5,10-methylenetetrahydrofolate dehydrogenase/5,10-methenyltetrahydrofolate cyclohydrolase [Verrucomicrobiota bacterium]
MSASIIDGNSIREEILSELKSEIAQLRGRKPKVVFIRVGEDPASVSYVKKKEKTATKIGMEAALEVYPESISEDELLGHVRRLNGNESVDGILVQAPLPKHIDEQRVFNAVSAEKDVDGFNASTVGRLLQDDNSRFVSCTPAGIIELLIRSGIKTRGAHAVIVGRSQIVGKPIAQLLLQRAEWGNATVTVCHSATRDLPAITKQADILVAAIGSPEFIKGDMLKPGAVVIDVGINRISDPSTKKGYRLVGDVEFEAASQIASKITPVPGGVGPMTVAMLMANTVKAYKLKRGL